MADNRIILIAADIAMHKFHIARAKALPGCKHRHCLERSNPPNRCHSWRVWRLMVLVILLCCKEGRILWRVSAAVLIESPVALRSLISKSPARDKIPASISAASR